MMQIDRIILPSGHAVLIDSADFERINKHSWYLFRTGRNNEYAKTDRRHGHILMHRLIMSPPKHLQIDHRDGNGLDNRRSNLRICTDLQNKLNTGKKRVGKRFKGVFFDKRHGTYYAQLWLNRKSYFGGRHKTEIEAAIAYNELAVQHHGEYARLNDIPRNRQ